MRKEAIGLKRFSLRFPAWPFRSFAFRKSSRRCTAAGAKANFQLNSTKTPRQRWFRTLTMRRFGMTEELIAQAVALLERFPRVVRMLYMSPAPRLGH